MKKTLIVGVITGILLAAQAGSAAAEDKQVSCGDIAVAMEEAADNVSAEEIAKKLNTSVARVRECWAKQEAPKKSNDAQTK